MDDRVIQFRVGVVIVGSLLIGATLLLWFGDGIRETYSVMIQYPSAPGVGVNTPVRKNGVRIGRITHVDLHDDRVLLTAEIEQGRVLRTSDSPHLTKASLLGDMIVDFVPSPGVPADEVRVVQAGEMIRGGEVSNGLTEVFQLVSRIEHRIDEALGSMAVAGNKIASLSEDFSGVVQNNEQRLQSILDHSEEALISFHQAMTGVQGVVGDDRLKAQLKEAIAGLPVLFNAAQTTLVDAGHALTEVEQASRQAQRNLQQLEGFTQPLGNNGAELVARIHQSLARVDEVTTQLSYFGRALNSADGTLSQLVHDPDLYHRLNRAAGNVEQMSRKLMPILNDTRVLADKLARDPSQLGLRGAMTRSRRAGDGVKYTALSSTLSR